MSNLFGGGKPAGNTTTVQSNEPWAGVQPYLSNLFGKGTDLLNGSAPQSIPTLQAQQMQYQRGLMGSPLNQAAQQQNLATIRGDYTDLSKNPAAQSAMDAARSQINSQFSGDNYGNSAHQEWLGRGLMSAASPFYESERQRQMAATALAPSLANQDYTDIGQVGAVGQQLTNAPWDQLQRYQGLLGSAGGYGTSTTQQPYFNNGLGALGVGGGALGGFLLGGPAGALMGASLGGLLGGR